MPLRRVTFSRARLVMLSEAKRLIGPATPPSIEGDGAKETLRWRSG
jgi:hypothetical protein